MAMGLASMNPMVGPNPNNNRGILLIRSNREDKDVKNSWNNYGATYDLDTKDYVSIDGSGRAQFRKMSELDESDVSIYEVASSDAKELMDMIVLEASKPYKDRIPYECNLYEYFTGTTQYVDDQPDYDPLLERVYLDKLTKTLNGIADQIDVESNRMVDGSTEGFYPLENRPRSTPDEEDSSVKFPMLSSAQIDLDEAEATFQAILNGEDETIVDD